jgi:hypothetical protein
MNELQVVEKLGMVKSTTVQQMTGKHLVSTIKQLNSLVKCGAIKMIILSKQNGERRLYMTPEMYEEICSK